MWLTGAARPVDEQFRSVAHIICVLACEITVLSEIE
jgi:hypothetical protein